ncbi:MAG: peptidoglycan DD-metalloendopeptidase family protein [Myxococcales bacterium]|nr:peptidoglycan DD-metalloendopeptidase family protein [Myxococcales bacterium]
MTLLALDNGLRPDSPRALEKAARQLEGFFWEMLLSEMRRSLPESDWLGEGAQGQMAVALFDQVMSEKLAAGASLGLAEAVTRSLSGAAETDPLVCLGLRDCGHISSAFGYRTDPFTGQPQFHNGIDIAAPEGQPFTALASGRVVQAGENGGLGLSVTVRHADGSEAVYGHLKAARVQCGDLVRAGQPLGEIGQSGRSTGPHLHLEVRRHGRSLDPRLALPGVVRAQVR